MDKYTRWVISIVLLVVIFLIFSEEALTDEHALQITKDYMRANFPSGEPFESCRIIDKSDNWTIKCGPEIKEHTFILDPRSQEIVQWNPGE